MFVGKTVRGPVAKPHSGLHRAHAAHGHLVEVVHVAEAAGADPMKTAAERKTIDCPAALQPMVNAWWYWTGAAPRCAQRRPGFSAWAHGAVEEWGQVVFVIGGACGFTDAVRQRADDVLALRHDFLPSSVGSGHPR
ncbi:MAG: 23S rRNA (pseudouridine(1915)-N(3))-methyltransferase RlmH [Flavobacteriales bacterium]|nr:23S rRNA (pseudouridine(1915)-N(3))-methyltransferase RlmH [Flavobacteriales bacterium]